MFNTEIEKNLALAALNEKIRDQHEPDWEQRRYEIAKELFCAGMTSCDNEARAWAFRHKEETARDAVALAGILVSKLKEATTTD